MRFFLLLTPLIAAHALAQPTLRPTPRPTPQVIDFVETDLIEGGTQKPLGEIYSVPPKSTFKSLIQVRMNFNDKLKESVHEM